MSAGVPERKYPELVMGSLRSWIPGDVAPSVKTTAIINHGGARIGITLTGIDPRREVQVSKLASQMREGKLDDLSRASNGVIIGEALAEKLGLKTGNTILLVGGQGFQLNSTVTGLFRSGLKRVDESQIYSLMGPAQVMMGQSGVVNQLRLRLSDPMLAREVAARVEAETGYKAVSWQEAHEDLLSTFAVRNIIVFTVMGAMLLTSSFATYNIISPSPMRSARDIAIMKSLGMREHAVRWIFIMEAAIIGVVGMLFGWVSVICSATAVEDHELQSRPARPCRCRSITRPCTMSIAGGIRCCAARCGLLPGAQGDARASGRNHPGGVMSEVALQAVELVRRIEGTVSTPSSTASIWR